MTVPTPTSAYDLALYLRLAAEAARQLSRDPRGHGCEDPLCERCVLREAAEGQLFTLDLFETSVLSHLDPPLYGRDLDAAARRAATLLDEGWNEVHDR
jgi:hypothetical protein